jgi:hypothetical protein
MIRLQERCHSLADLMVLRTTLRQQETLVDMALREVQRELASWRRHRQSHELAGKSCPPELCRVWEELAERERELVLDLLQIRAAAGETNRQIRTVLQTPRKAS